MGETIRVPKTAELIAAQLRRQIVSGELEEGLSLPSELAERRTSKDLDDLRGCIDKLRDVAESQAGQEAPDVLAWSMLTQQFHDLVVQRAGNRTIAVQTGVLREVVSAHLAVAVARLFDPVHTPEGLRVSIRSYTKLVDLIAISDAEGAEKHWRRHMEVAAATLMHGEEAQATVDLFA